MLDAILKRRRPANILDVGTGSGVLALAAARALRRKVAAGDVDPVAVAAARANVRANRATPWLLPVVAKGVTHPDLRAGAPYDLIFANILAKPLRRLAPALAELAAPAAEIVLSGLLARDVAGILSAYGPHHFTLARRIDIDGWASLLLARRRSSRPSLRCRHAPAHIKLAAMFESRFQTFTETADPSQGAARVARLRAELERRGLEGFIVPRADEHQNEYVPKSAERLAWLTGFTGSAGLAIVLKTKAAIFVDGRYSAAGARTGRCRCVFAAAARRRDAGILARSQSRGRPGGSATIPGCTRRLRSNGSRPPRKRPAHRSSPSAPIRSMRSGSIGRRRRRARSCCIPSATAAKRRAPSSAAWRRRSTRSTRSSSATRMRSPGRSTFAVTISRIRRSPLAYCLIPATGRPSLYVERAKLSAKRRRRTRHSRRNRRAGGPAAGSRKTGRRAQDGAFRCRDGAGKTRARASKMPAERPISGRIRSP